MDIHRVARCRRPLQRSGGKYLLDQIGGYIGTSLFRIESPQGKVGNVALADTLLVLQSRCDMGSRDLRSLLLQSGPYLLSLLRTGGVHGGPLFCGRKGGETVQKENGRAGEACQQEHQGYSVSRFKPGPGSGRRIDQRKVT